MIFLFFFNFIFLFSTVKKFYRRSTQRQKSIYNKHNPPPPPQMTTVPLPFAEQALNAAHAKLLARCADRLQPLPESAGWTVRWPKETGTAILTVLIWKSGRLRIEFFRELAYGLPAIIEPNDMVLLRLRNHPGVTLKLRDPQEWPIIYGVWPLNSEPDTHIPYLLDLLDMLIDGGNNETRSME